VSSFYTKDRNGRKSLLPRGVLPSDNMGVPNGNGATLRRQEVSSPTTAGQGGGDVFTRSPSGVFYQVVQHGSGPKPTSDQRVRYDYMGWRDDFDGQDATGEGRGLVLCVSGQPEWWQEVFTDMRVGEVRRVIAPARLTYTGKEAYLEYRLVAIL